MNFLCPFSSVAQSCLTLCNPMDSSPSGSSVHGIFQVKILELVAISFSRGSSRPRDRTLVSWICKQILCHCAIWKKHISCKVWISSLQFSCSVMSNSLQPHGLQHARLPCPSPTHRACWNSCPLRRWCHSISSSVVPFSSGLQSFPASGSFPMSQFFTSGGQRTGVSASA